MKKIIFLLIFSIIYFFPINIYAANNPLLLILKGEVILYTCGVAESEVNKYVKLGRYSTKDMQGKGAKSQSIPIPFALINCGPNRPVTITFNGTRDLVDNELLKLTQDKSVAKNIAIEMQDAQRNRLPLGKKSGYISDSDGNVHTQFYAHYITTEESPTPGKAKANATFLIEYE